MSFTFNKPLKYTQKFIKKYGKVQLTWYKMADDGKYTLAVAKELQDEIDLTDNFALREPYDKIIRCLGFSFDKSIFNQYV